MSQVQRPQGTTETARATALPEACSSPASAAQADGDGLNAPEASTKAACW